MIVSTTSASISSQITTSDWVQIGSTLLLGALAVLAPYFAERLKHRYFKPGLKIKFKLAPPGCHKTRRVGRGYDFPVYYFRFLIENFGKTQAEDCEVFLENVFRENSAGEMVKNKSFTPVNLKWSGIRDPYKRTIQPGKEMYCDLGRVQHPDDKFHSVFKGFSKKDEESNKFIFEFPERYYSQQDCLTPGKYKIEVSVYSNNAKKTSRHFLLSWTGEWKDKEESMFSELVIR
ncbi:MAG: hypothetical protein JW991_00635 [Candidatus Pacebacteria bacterium]|nr:hypothetical protein [Candidatus Paceibacterota bacterium]